MLRIPTTSPPLPLHPNVIGVPNLPKPRLDSIADAETITFALADPGSSLRHPSPVEPTRGGLETTRRAAAQTCSILPEHGLHQTSNAQKPSAAASQSVHHDANTHL